jgi:transposase
MRTGARWRDLPDAYPSAATCWRKLKALSEVRVGEIVWRAFLRDLDEDATMTVSGIAPRAQTLRLATMILGQA